MPTSLLYRLFRMGRLPQSDRPVLEAEGLVSLEEGLSGTVTYRHFQGHGRFFSWRRVWFAGSIAVTRERLAVFAFRRRLVNVPHLDPKRSKLEVRLERASTLLMAFDASLFGSGYSGRVEIRFKTDNATKLHQLLSEPTGQPKGVPKANA